MGELPLLLWPRLTTLSGAMAFVLLLSSESQLFLPALPLLLPDLSSALLSLLLPLPLLVLSLPAPPLLDLSLLRLLLLMTTLTLPSMLERTRMPMAMCRDPTPSTFL